MTSVFRRPQANNYFASSRTWMQDNRLTCKAIGLLARMLSMPPDWEFHQSHLASILVEGVDTIQSYMKELVKFGYLIKSPKIRQQNGQWGSVVYQVFDSPQSDVPIEDSNIELIFSNSFTISEFKNIYPERENPDQVNAVQEKAVLQRQEGTIPSGKEINKGNVSSPAKVMPSSTKTSKTKFPLKKEQRPLLTWLQSQNIDSDEDNLKYYIRTYTEERIRDAVAFIDREVAKGVKIRSRGGFLRRALEGQIVIQNAASDENKALAVDFASLNDWASVIITEKYLRDDATGEDVYFNLSPATFADALNRLHDKHLLYK